MIPTHKIHIGAYAFIANGGKIALIHKSRGPYTGQLDLPGGKIEYGEKIEDCLKREVDEELGAKIESFELFRVFQNSIEYKENGEVIRLQHIGIVYKVKLVDPAIKNIQAHDSLGSAWHNLKTIDESNLTPFARLCVNEIRKSKNR